MGRYAITLALAASIIAGCAQTTRSEAPTTVSALLQTNASCTVNTEDAALDRVHELGRTKGADVKPYVIALMWFAKVDTACASLAFKAKDYNRLKLFTEQSADAENRAMLLATTSSDNELVVGGCNMGRHLVQQYVRIGRVARDLNDHAHYQFADDGFSKARNWVSYQCGS